MNKENANLLTQTNQRRRAFANVKKNQPNETPTDSHHNNLEQKEDNQNQETSNIIDQTNTTRLQGRPDETTMDSMNSRLMNEDDKDKKGPQDEKSLFEILANNSKLESEQPPNDENKLQVPSLNGTKDKFFQAPKSPSNKAQQDPQQESPDKQQQQQQDQQQQGAQATNAQQKMQKEQKNAELSEFDKQELKNLAQQLGIDIDKEVEEFGWLLLNMIQVDLPEGWVKEMDPNRNVVYYNQFQNVSSIYHPLINRYRALFNEILAKKEIWADKYNQESEEISKIMKMQKKPLKLSTKGSQLRFSSKMGSQSHYKSISMLKSQHQIENKPEEKEMQLLEEGKGKERFKQLYKELSKIHEIEDKAQKELILKRQLQGNEISIQDYDRALEESFNYYVEKYGVHPPSVLNQLDYTDSFMRADPDEVANAILYLKITSQDEDLFWIGRAFASMEPPDLWLCVHESDKEGKYYVYQVYNLKLNIHPCYKYILTLLQAARIEKLKKEQKQKAEKDAQDKIARQGLGEFDLAKLLDQQLEQKVIKEDPFNMVFFDILQRSYDIDMRELVHMKEIELNLDPSKQIYNCAKNFVLSKIEAVQDEFEQINEDEESDIGDMDNEEHRQEDNANNGDENLDEENVHKKLKVKSPKMKQPRMLQQQLAKLQQQEEEEKKKEEAQKLKQMLEKQQQLQLQQKKNKLRRVAHQRQSSNLKDNHLLALCNVFNIKLPEEVHLLPILNEFIIFKERTEEANVWKFRMTDQGEFYWINSKKLMSSKEFPYYDELLKIITLFKKSLQKEITGLQIKGNILQDVMKYFKVDDELQAFQAIREEAKKFVIKYLINKPNDKVLDFNKIAKNTDAPQDGKPENSQQNNNEGKQKSYKLKVIFQLLRGDIQYTDEQLKNQVLFIWPYMFQPKERSNPNKKKKKFIIIHKKKSEPNDGQDKNNVIDEQEEAQLEPYPGTVEILTNEKYFQGNFTQEKYNYDTTDDEDIDLSEDSNNSILSEDQEKAQQQQQSFNEQQIDDVDKQKEDNEEVDNDDDGSQNNVKQQQLEIEKQQENEYTQEKAKQQQNINKNTNQENINQVSDQDASQEENKINNYNKDDKNNSEEENEDKQNKIAIEKVIKTKQKNNKKQKTIKEETIEQIDDWLNELRNQSHSEENLEKEEAWNLEQSDSNNAENEETNFDQQSKDENQNIQQQFLDENSSENEQQQQRVQLSEVQKQQKEKIKQPQQKFMRPQKKKKTQLQQKKAEQSNQKDIQNQQAKTKPPTQQQKEKAQQKQKIAQQNQEKKNKQQQQQKVANSKQIIQQQQQQKLQQQVQNQKKKVDELQEKINQFFAKSQVKNQEEQKNKQIQEETEKTNNQPEKKQDDVDESNQQKIEQPHFSQNINELLERYEQLQKEKLKIQQDQIVLQAANSLEDKNNIETTQTNQDLNIVLQEKEEELKQLEFIKQYKEEQTLLENLKGDLNDLDQQNNQIQSREVESNQEGEISLPESEVSQEEDEYGELQIPSKQEIPLAAGPANKRLTMREDRRNQILQFLIKQESPQEREGENAIERQSIMVKQEAILNQIKGKQGTQQIEQEKEEQKKEQQTQKNQFQSKALKLIHVNQLTQNNIKQKKEEVQDQKQTQLNQEEKKKKQIDEKQRQKQVLQKLFKGYNENIQKRDQLIMEKQIDEQLDEKQKALRQKQKQYQKLISSKDFNTFEGMRQKSKMIKDLQKINLSIHQQITNNTTKSKQEQLVDQPKSLIDDNKQQQLTKKSNQEQQQQQQQANNIINNKKFDLSEDQQNKFDKLQNILKNYIATPQTLPESSVNEKTSEPKNELGINIGNQIEEKLKQKFINQLNISDQNENEAEKSVNSSSSLDDEGHSIGLQQKQQNLNDQRQNEDEQTELHQIFDHKKEADKIKLDGRKSIKIQNKKEIIINIPQNLRIQEVQEEWISSDEDDNEIARKKKKKPVPSVRAYDQNQQENTQLKSTIQNTSQINKSQTNKDQLLSNFDNQQVKQPEQLPNLQSAKNKPKVNTIIKTTVAVTKLKNNQQKQQQSQIKNKQQQQDTTSINLNNNQNQQQQQQQISQPSQQQQQQNTNVDLNANKQQQSNQQIQETQQVIQQIVIQEEAKQQPSKSEQNEQNSSTIQQDQNQLTKSNNQQQQISPIPDQQVQIIQQIEQSARATQQIINDVKQLENTSDTVNLEQKLPRFMQDLLQKQQQGLQNSSKSSRSMVNNNQSNGHSNVNQQRQMSPKNNLPKMMNLQDYIQNKNNQVQILKQDELQKQLLQNSYIANNSPNNSISKPFIQTLQPKKINVNQIGTKKSQIPQKEDLEQKLDKNKTFYQSEANPQEEEQANNTNYNQEKVINCEERILSPFTLNRVKELVEKGTIKKMNQTSLPSLSDTKVGPIKAIPVSFSGSFNKSRSLSPIVKNKSALSSQQFDQKSNNLNSKIISSPRSPRSGKHRLLNPISQGISQLNNNNNNQKNQEEIQISTQSDFYRNNNSNSQNNLCKTINNGKQEDLLQYMNQIMDNFTNYRLKKTLMEFSKHNPFVWFDFRDPYFSNQSERTDQGAKFFHIKALQQLDILKAKFLKNKFDQLIFDFIISQVNIPQEIIKTIIDSDELKSRFYECNMLLFKKLRNSLCKIPNLQQKWEQLITGEQLDKDLKQQIDKILMNNSKYEIKQLNQGNLFIQILSNKYEEEKRTQSLQDENDINPFKQKFNMLQSQVFIESLIKGTQINLQNTYDTDDFDNDEDLEYYRYQKEKQKVDNEIQRKNYINQHYRSVSCVFRYQEFSQLIEQFEKDQIQNQMWSALTQELDQIHNINRSYIRRFEMFLDYGLKPQHLMKMCQRLDISVQKEGDIHWIAYLYCMFLLRYSPSQDIQVLSKVLKISINDEKSPVDYDKFFINLVKFNKIKRQFILRKLIGKQITDYLQQNAWMKFFDEKKDQIQYVNIALNKTVYELPTQIIYYQDKFLTLEQAIFIEMLEGMANLIKDDQLIYLIDNNNNAKLKTELNVLNNLSDQTINQDYNQKQRQESNLSGQKDISTIIQSGITSPQTSISSQTFKLPKIISTNANQ